MRVFRCGQSTYSSNRLPTTIALHKPQPQSPLQGVAVEQIHIQHRPSVTSHTKLSSSLGHSLVSSIDRLTQSVSLVDQMRIKPRHIPADALEVGAWLLILGGGSIYSYVDRRVRSSLYDAPQPSGGYYRYVRRGADIIKEVRHDQCWSCVITDEDVRHTQIVQCCRRRPIEHQTRELGSRSSISSLIAVRVLKMPEEEV